MRGGEGTSLGFLPSHSLAISVSEPQKVRKWLLAKVVYQIRYNLSSWMMQVSKINFQVVAAPELRMPTRILAMEPMSPVVVVVGVSPSRGTTMTSLSSTTS